MDILQFIRDRAGDYDCPVCRDPLVDCSLKLLREEGNTFTVQVGCAHCQVTFVVVLQVRGDLAAAARATRRAAAAPAEPPPAPPISADELLDLHEALRDFDGGFTELLGRVQSRSRTA